MKYFIVLILLLAGCDNAPEKSIKGDFDRSGKPQKITVYVYESKADMQRAFSEILGAPRNTSRVGWSEWAPHNPEWGCGIHVTKIKHLNDNSQMATWGHELAHCIYGAYHKEEQE